MQIRSAVDSKTLQGARGRVLWWDRALDSIPHTLLCLRKNKAHSLSIVARPEYTSAGYSRSPRGTFVEEKLCNVPS